MKYINKLTLGIVLAAGLLQPAAMMTVSKSPEALPLTSKK